MDDSDSTVERSDEASAEYAVGMAMVMILPKTTVMMGLMLMRKDAYQCPGDKDDDDDFEDAPHDDSRNYSSSGDHDDDGDMKQVVFF